MKRLCAGILLLLNLCVSAQAADNAVPPEADDFLRLKIQAEQGEANAQYRLALRYDSGTDV